jgi:sugar diacid utilization regulator
VLIDNPLPRGGVLGEELVNLRNRPVGHDRHATRQRRHPGWTAVFGSQLVTTGAAGASGGQDGIVPAYLQARRCLEALLTLGRCGESATLDDLGFAGLLLSDRRDVPGFIRSVIGTLIDYDTRNGTELVRTVEAYFGTGCSLARTRHLLHVHVNTVTQRLDRVTRLLGEGWQLGDRALEICVAIRLYRLSPAMGGGAGDPGPAYPPGRDPRARASRKADPHPGSEDLRLLPGGRGRAAPAEHQAAR